VVGDWVGTRSRAVGSGFDCKSSCLSVIIIQTIR
jgi:hypothetical protein